MELSDVSKAKNGDVVFVLQYSGKGIGICEGRVIEVKKYPTVYVFTIALVSNGEVVTYVHEGVFTSWEQAREGLGFPILDEFSCK